MSNMSNLVKVGMTPNIKSLKEVSKKKYNEGFNYNKYVEFLESRINKETKFFSENPDINKVYRYKDLNSDQIEYLKNNFKKLEQHFNNLNTKKYEDIKFRNKQKKNYNKKKNELIESYTIKMQDKLETLTKNKFKGNKEYSEWAICYTELNQYNRIVPNAHSRESLRDIILNKTRKKLKNTDWVISTSKFYFDNINKKKYYNKDNYSGNNILLEYDYVCWKKVN